MKTHTIKYFKIDAQSRMGIFEKKKKMNQVWTFQHSKFNRVLDSDVKRSVEKYHQ